MIITTVAGSGRAEAHGVAALDGASSHACLRAASGPCCARIQAPAWRQSLVTKHRAGPARVSPGLGRVPYRVSYGIFQFNAGQTRRSSARAEIGRGSSPTSKDADVQLYGKIERVFSDSAKWSQAAAGTGKWDEVEGAWVLRPPSGIPAVSVVHFIGGAFVGASPQLTYRPFLEILAQRGLLIVATPYACGFDHLRIADEAQFRFDRCIRALASQAPSATNPNPQLVQEIPVYGLGHSMGALTHLLIGARYAVQRAGNVLVSFNNKEASRAIPLFSPVIMPMAQNMGPILTQLLQNPTLKMGTDLALKQLRQMNSPFVDQILPLVEQLPPLYSDLSNGRDEFTPTPEETKGLIRSYYGVKRNLLVRFKEDMIDETPMLADALSVHSSVSVNLDLSIRTLPGDHARPLQQVLPDIPEAVARAVDQGSQFLSGVPGASPFADLARDFISQSLSGTIPGTPGIGLGSAQQIRARVVEDLESLVDEIAPFMGGSFRDRARPVNVLPG